MKKIFALTLAVLMVMGLFTGCVSSGDNNTETYYTVSDKFKDANVTTVVEGKLTVSLSPDFAPMEFVDLNGNFVGFDVILANYIADSLGLELNIVPMSFEASQTAVSTGAVDMSISGYSWTEKRANNYNLSDWYHAGENEDNQVLITLKANEGKYTTAESLKGLKVGAQGSSLQEDLCKDQLADCELVQFSDINTALLQLQNGDFEVMAVAEGNAKVIIEQNKELFAMAGFSFVVDEKYTDNVIMLQKGNDDLTDIVNQILAESKQYWDAWYAAAQNIAGVDTSYDDDGNKITEPSE